MNNSEFQAILAVSNAIATVRDKVELWRVIFEQIKPLFAFHDCGLFLFNRDKTELEDLTVSWPQISPSEANQLLAQQQVATFTYANSPWELVFGRLRAANGPIIHDYSEEIPGWEQYVQASVINQIGYQESMMAILQTRGNELGVFAINSLDRGHFQKSQLDFFQAVANALAVAVANILANEEILEREREKVLQLAVTTSLTSQLPWVDKFRQVIDVIDPVIPWDMANIFVWHRPALSLHWEKDEAGMLRHLSHEQYSRMLGISPMALTDLLTETQSAREQSTVYGGTDFDDLRQPVRLIDLLYRHGAVRAQIDLPITVNGSPEVLLVFYSRKSSVYTDTHRAILQRLMPLVSLALENIFSFEALGQREAEKTRQLALNKVLVSINDSPGLYRAMAEELHELVAFDMMSVRVISQNTLLDYVALSRVNGHFIDITEQVRASYPTLEQEELLDATASVGQGTVYTGDAFGQRCTSHPLYRLRLTQYGIRSAMELPLPMKEGQPALLTLSSRTAYAFTEGDLIQLALFIPQIALALENRLSFQEITTLKKRLEQEKSYLVEEIKISHNFEEIIGTSPLLTEVFRQVGQVAPTDTTVLITGESGTGKELIARAVHNRSPRKDKVLVKINCAALPASLIESELFGHDKGAFTGAIDKRIGKFELANGGTIFLDEIGELPLELQGKLLRVIQEREYERLGSNKTLKADVRVIAATNRNLEQEVKEGRFRLDLFYRLSVFPVHMPPLRERTEDIPLLAYYFAQRYCKKMGKPFRGIQETTMLTMVTYSWPGNIRELENVLEQCAIVNDGKTALAWSRSTSPVSLPAQSITSESVQQALPPAEPVTQTIGAIREASAALERDRILTVLKQTNGRIRGDGGAAQLLGLKATTLEARMARLGIKRDYTVK